MQKVGFIGAGSMGGPMAKRVHQAGFDLHVCEVRADVRDDFAARGVPTTEKAMELGNADFVIILVANDTQLQETIFGPQGLLAGIDARRPPMLIVMSTILPAMVQELGEKLTANRVRVLEAPVSGGVARAENGTLTIMAGGDEADYKAALPLLQSMGDKQFYCGPPGSAALTKLINNIIGIGNVYLASEAYALALKLGGDLAKIIPILETGTGRNFTSTSVEDAQKWFGAFLDPPRGFFANMEINRKDMQLVAQLAQQAQVQMPIVGGLTAGIAKIFEEGVGDAVFQQWKSIAEA